jgi:iron complex outermembrane receptor protein
MMRRSFLALILGVSALTPLRAQEAEPLDALLNTPISTAAKYDQQMNEVPASVTVISAEEIARYGWHTLADVLQSIRGVYTTSDRGYTYLGVRGIGLPSDYNNRFLVLLDGHPMVESVSGSIGLGTTLAIDLSNLARIEFVRGPGSVLYGTGAMFGVINLITKEPEERPWVTVAAGSGGWYTGATRASMQVGEVKASIGASWQERSGFSFYYPEFDTPATNDGVVRGHDFDDYRGFLGTLEWRNLRVLMLDTTRTKGLPTASWGTTFGGDERITDARRMMALELNHRLGPGRNLHVEGFYDRFGYHGNYPREVGGYTDRSRSTRVGGEARYLWDVRSNHRLTFGAAVSKDVRADYSWTTASGEHVVEGDNSHQSLFVNSELGLSRRITLTTGASVDHFASGVTNLTPRGALIMHMNPDATMKLLYSSGFRAPSVYESEFHSGVFLHSEDLQAEQIRTAELVWEQRLSSNLLFTASVFDLQATKLIRLQSVDDDKLQFQNLGDVHARGIEVQLDDRRSDGIWSYLSYTRQRADEDGARMMNSPLNMLKGGVSTPTSNRWYGGLELQYETGRPTKTGEMTDASLLANVNLGVALTEHIGLSVAMRNAFDAAYATPGGLEHVQNTLEQDGRTFLVRLQLKAGTR